MMQWIPTIARCCWLVILTFSYCAQVNADWLKQSQDIMGTRVTVELWSENSTDANHCSDKVFAEMHRIDRLMSPYKSTSEVFDINQNAAQRLVIVSPELFKLLQQSTRFSEQ